MFGGKWYVFFPSKPHTENRRYVNRNGAIH